MPQGQNLYQLTRDRGARRFPEATLRSWLRQVLQGLAYLHARGYFHRDIKPGELKLSSSPLTPTAPPALWQPLPRR
jgi:serine/threonine protein kinase